MAQQRRQPSAKIQGTQGAKDAQQYLADLDALLKRNTGQGTFVGQDTSSNTPMYLPGKVRNASGLTDTPSTMAYGNGMQQPQPVDRPQEMIYEEPPQEQPQQPINIEDFLQQFEQSYNAPQNQQQFGDPRVEFIGSTQDGGNLMADGTIVYEDGTIRNGDPNAQAIASDVGGGTRYSDGSIRKQAPNAISSIAGDRERIGYDDGSQRWGQYQYGQNSSPVQLPGGLQGLNTGLFGQNQAITQDFGNYNPQLEPGSGYNMGTDFRTRDLSGGQRQLKLPVGAEVVQVLQDDGTQWGDISGHQGYGNSVLVRLPTGEMLRFSHLDQMMPLQPGQRIEAGQVFGTPGQTGNTTGEHLDLEYYDQTGQISDPSAFSGFSDPQGLRSPLPGQAAPGTLASSVNQPQAQNQPIASQAPQQQNTQPLIAQAVGNVAQKAVQAPVNVFNATKEAAQPMSPQREQLGSGINALGKKANLPEAYLGEIASGQVSPGQGASYALEGNLPKTRIDTGISELLRGDLQGAQKNFADTSARVGARLQNLPGQINNAIAPPAYADDGTQKPALESLGSNLKGAAASIGQYAGDKFGAAGEGIKSLGQSGIANLSNVFTPKQDVTKRAIGDVSGTAEGSSQPGQFSSLMDTASSVAGNLKNDIRDPFFKMGGSDIYKNFLKPGADSLAGGALTMDLFNNDFFKDLGNISSVFGGSKDLGAATEKYVDFERQKYQPMQKMGYEEGYDRGDVDNYNRQVDQYNAELNNYFNSIRSSTAGAKGDFLGAPTSKPKNVFSSSGSNSFSAAPISSKMSAPSFSSKFSAPALTMNRSYAQMNVPTSANASLARPSSSPAMSRPATSLPPTTQKSVAAPRPAMSLPPTTQKSVAPIMSKAPAPQSKPKQNIFSKAISTIKNVFRR